jgi:hypothetical protein
MIMKKLFAFFWKTMMSVGKNDNTFNISTRACLCMFNKIFEYNQTDVVVLLLSHMIY